MGENGKMYTHIYRAAIAAGNQLQERSKKFRIDCGLVVMKKLEVYANFLTIACVVTKKYPGAGVGFCAGLDMFTM